MATNKGIEESLNDAFVKNAPFQLPEGFKKFLVDIAPWASLLVGIISVLGAWSIYQWARVANAYVDLANQLSTYYGGTAISTNRWTIWIYISLVVLVVEAVIYFAAFSGLKNRKKQGWNLLYLGLWINVVYGLVGLFSDYGSAVGTLLSSIIGTVIGLYFLFQIRSYYLGGAAKKPAAAKTSTK